jgi:hypothetical protein
MDLGTVMEKLKSGKYNSKEAFVNDLNLIWANCFKYNADPAHPLRKHAIFMRNETKRLVKTIDSFSALDDLDAKWTQGIMGSGQPGVSEESDPPQDPLPPTDPLKEQTPKLFVARTISQDLTGSEASKRKDLLCALQERPRTLKINSGGLRLGSKRMFAEESGSGSGTLTPSKKSFAEENGSGTMKLSKRLFAEESGNPFGKRRKI